MAQYELDLVDHTYGGEIIRQRASDGYINATAMCQAGGREWRRYRRLDSTKEYLRALSSATGIRSSKLIITRTGGDYKTQGSWVHPHLLPNGVEVEARQYHNSVLPAFIEYIENEWLPKRAKAYFKERDKKALEYLPKLLPPSKKKVRR